MSSSRASKQSLHEQLPSRLRRRALVFDVIDSTNRVARDWSADGADAGSFVLADHQSAGRGRLGRTWNSTPGSSLLLSMIWDIPDAASAKLSLIPLAAAVAVTRSIESVYRDLMPTIKWPNDLLIGGRKCGGILAESVRGSAGTRAIIGVGLNVHRTEFSTEVRFPPTWIDAETTLPVERIDLLARLVDELDGAATRFQAVGDSGDAWLLSEYRKRLLGIDRPITFQRDSSGDRVSGHFRGVSDSGAMILESDGRVSELWAGEISGINFEPDKLDEPAR
ncbi:MAG: biotin--[acetyl-CoA-carboxylase] ligase [Rhodothermales bacterium]